MVERFKAMGPNVGVAVSTLCLANSPIIAQATFSDYYAVGDAEWGIQIVRSFITREKIGKFFKAKRIKILVSISNTQLFG